MNDLADRLGNPEDTATAGRVATAVFGGIRDRIPVAESFHFISQLPLILKGVYVDGWNISRERSESRTMADFIDDIRGQSPRTQSRDFGNDQEAQDRIRQVFRSLQEYISPGQMEHLKNSLPRSIAEGIL